ncbi:MAG: HypC/HybG/HupF family hydrogenase formation chaperone [Betaproteobacteria bacterium HGW-Betaproteobacteria-13]|jgi:hydrogenase expression/formation protein HypC|nr:MAG: HypC/HybG/HupF family hydrogenase formation chaperone [Betaproteobacteria bacterium HGW-Betaproteobacteria-19]PKO79449.1 MAG: HypC/HybG/HupF family hydrogenase formation chaperone [Betaproteobacteria bacterium HGW-Betaproteobacteria-13]
MCVGIPLQVQRMEGSVALCTDLDGVEHRIDTLLVGPQTQGVWLMAFLGAARAVIDEAEAARVGAALNALSGLMAGQPVDLDAAFADLVDREPQLPEFLRGPRT